MQVRAIERRMSSLLTALAWPAPGLEASWGIARRPPPGPGERDPAAAYPGRVARHRLGTSNASRPVLPHGRAHGLDFTRGQPHCARMSAGLDIRTANGVRGAARRAPQLRRVGAVSPRAGPLLRPSAASAAPGAPMPRHGRAVATLHASLASSDASGLRGRVGIPADVVSESRALVTVTAHRWKRRDLDVPPTPWRITI
jgi:hypothetical protein